MIHMYLRLVLVSPTCPLLRSDQSRGLAPRGQALSTTSPYARFCFPFVFNLPVFTFHRQSDQSPRSPIQVSPRIKISHLCFAPFRTYLALFRIASHCHNPTVSTRQNTPGDDPLPPNRTPQSHIGFTPRSPVT